MTAQISEYRANIDALGEIAERDPERFLTILAAQNPAYRKYLSGSAGSSSGTADRRPGATVDPNATAPAPDVQLADGTRTYGVEGLQKLLDLAGSPSRTARRLP